MKRTTITKKLKGNPYPGRGIILGRSADASKAVVAYFIMGRSENSRNRIFVPADGGIRTEAFDPQKLSDPSLIIYSPVALLDHLTIVSNGDQTDTIRDHLDQHKSFEQALQTRTFEPDAPNFTPRISGILVDFSYRLSILKSAAGNPDSVQRFFYDYPTPLAGEGHLIHTYQCDGTPLPSFEGEPLAVEIQNDLDSFTKEIWDNLNEENKVSLFTRFIDVKTGTYETRILNKNCAD